MLIADYFIDLIPHILQAKLLKQIILTNMHNVAIIQRTLSNRNL